MPVAARAPPATPCPEAQGTQDRAATLTPQEGRWARGLKGNWSWLFLPMPSSPDRRRGTPSLGMQGPTAVLNRKGRQLVFFFFFKKQKKTFATVSLSSKLILFSHGFDFMAPHHVRPSHATMPAPLRASPSRSQESGPTPRVTLHSIWGAPRDVGPSAPSLTSHTPGRLGTVAAGSEWASRGRAPSLGWVRKAPWGRKGWAGARGSPRGPLWLRIQLPTDPLQELVCSEDQPARPPLWIGL